MFIQIAQESLKLDGYFVELDEHKKRHEINLILLKRNYKGQH